MLACVADHVGCTDKARQRRSRRPPSRIPAAAEDPEEEEDDEKNLLKRRERAVLDAIKRMPAIQAFIATLRGMHLDTDVLFQGLSCSGAYQGVENPPRPTFFVSGYPAAESRDEATSRTAGTCCKYSNSIERH